MNIITNQNFSPENSHTIITLSGFGAPILSQNVKNIMDFANENHKNVVTFEKRGMGTHPQEFTISGVSEDIAYAIEYTLSKYPGTRITLVTNSLTTPSFMDAYSYRISHDMQQKIFQIICLCPVTDVCATFSKVTWKNLKQWTDNERLLWEIGKMKNTRIDTNKMNQEIYTYNQDFFREYHKNNAEKTLYCINEQDTIITPEQILILPDARIQKMTDIPWDSTYHSIDAKEILHHLL